jgi:hypothetical protein
VGFFHVAIVDKEKEEEKEEEDKKCGTKELVELLSMPKVVR